MFARRRSPGEPIDDRFVLDDGGRGPGSVGNRLAEQGRVRVQTGVVQSPQHRNTLVQRLSRDEAGGSESHAVAVDGSAKQATVGGAQNCGSRDPRERRREH